MDTRDSGFTLIELLIVVVIIGILAAIAIPKFNATREKAYFASMKSDLRNLASLEEVYYNSNYSFTNNMTSLEFVASDAVTIVIGEATNLGWSASAVHQGMPTTESCAIYHGNAAAVTPATVPSAIACTR